MQRGAVAVAVAGMMVAASALACNAPADTPVVTGAPSAGTGVPPATESVTSPTPPPAETEAVSPTLSASPPGTPTVETPSPTPTPTATQPAEVEPLEIGSPGFDMVDWSPLPGTGEWEGQLRITFSGGVPPYQFALEGNQPQDENLLTLRWRNCKNAPLTVRVLSGDGQEARKQIWIESPYCPESDQ